MNRVNCWEHKQCGRQPGGRKSQELGICPVAVDRDFHGAHGGTNAGRACWLVAGSLCGGKVQGTYAQKLSDCWRCDFFNTVKAGEAETEAGFLATRLGVERYLDRRRKD